VNKLKLEKSIEDMRKKKIFVATPMYGGQCHGTYTKASVDLQAACGRLGIEVRFFYLFNESLITRARNYLVDEFLRSGFTHLMFIDSDIHFNPNDVLALVALCEDDKDIVCGPYPKKCIAWERIVSAVQQGVGVEKPEELEQFVGDFVFNPVGGTDRINIGEPVEVLEGGTGFMCIQREALLKYQESYPEFMYRPDHNRSEHFDGTREICAFFDCIIEPETRRYLSEDYMFCQWSRKIGLKVWMCPWMQLTHIGTYTFAGNLPAIAQLPNASHGGVIDKPASKAGHGNPNIVVPNQSPQQPIIQQQQGPTDFTSMVNPIDPDKLSSNISKEKDLSKRRAKNRAARKARKKNRK